MRRPRRALAAAIGLALAAMSAVPVAPASGAAGTVYVFPIAGSARASYGRIHHDYPATDIFAPCGATVVSPAAGVVSETNLIDRWRPKTDVAADRGGLSVTVVDADGVRYYGSHLARVAPGIAAGVEVAAGTPLGVVGRTGNARGTPCHLHFGLSPACGVGDWAVRRGVLYPWPYLDAWRAGRPRSPAPAVRSWRAKRGCPTAR